MIGPRPPYRQSLAGTLLAAREAVMNPIRLILRDAGLTEQQWRVLRVLVDEGESDASGLSEAGLLRPPSVTRILKELDERGLLTKGADPSDGRRSVVSVTAEGRKLFEATSKKTSVVLEEYRTRFGPQRMEALQNELRALVAEIGPMSGRGD